MRSIQLIFVCALFLAACSARDQDESRAQAQRAVNAIPSPVKQGVSDAALTAAVAAAIAGQSGINVFHISPSAHEGVVTLRGTVPTGAIKSTVLQTVRRLHGVRSVVDHIGVGGT